MTQTARWFLLASLVVLAAATRWLPHPPNFTPILGLLVFSSFVVKRRWISLPLVLAVVVVSDLMIGFYPMAGLVYLSYALVGLVMWKMGQSGLGQSAKSWAHYGLSGFVASVVFFISSNFAVWLAGNLYPRTMEGLWACYVAALPFFQNTLMSTLVYSLGLAAVWKAAERVWPEQVAASSRAA